MVASNRPGRDPIVVQERGVYSGQNQGFQSQIVQGNFNTQGGSINIINNVLPEPNTPHLYDSCCASLRRNYGPGDDIGRIRTRIGEIVPETCQWILSDPQYTAWRKPSGSGILWLSGGPGKGKTTMSLLVLDSIRELVACDTEQILLSVFCDSQEERRRSALDVLKSLILQILEHRKDLFEQVSQHFDPINHSISGPRVRDVESLWPVFQCLASSGPIYCILDGLDDCEEPTEVVELLRKFQTHVTENAATSGVGSLKLFISSQPSPATLRNVLRNSPTLDLESPILAEETARSIERYINFRIDQLPRDELPEERRDRVKSTLLAGAEGIYLWVSLICDQLRQGDGLEPLSRIPKGLGPKVGRIIQQHLSFYRQEPEKKAQVLELFHLLAVSMRPMTLEELCIALAVEDDENMLAAEHIRMRLRACEPLIVIEGGCVKLIHKSFQDGFLPSRGELDEFQRHDFELDEFQRYDFELHYWLGQICFTYLCQHRTYFLYPPGKTATADPPFIKYSATFWTEHLRRCENQKGTQIQSLIFGKGEAKKCLNDLRLVRRWWQETWKHRYQVRLNRLVPQKFNLAHMAAAFGIQCLLQFATSQCTEGRGRRKLLRERDSSTRTPLSWAVENGRALIVKHFLDIDPQVDERQGPYGTALQTAAAWGEWEIADWLIIQDADINARLGIFGSAIQAASACGNTKIVDRLLNATVELNQASNGWFGNPLQAAAAKGFVPIVKRLLGDNLPTYKADVNATGGWFGSSLRAAAAFGHLDVVRILLRCGANVQAHEDSESILPSHFTHSRKELLTLFKGISLRQLMKMGLAEGTAIKARLQNAKQGKMSFTQAMECAMEQVLLGNDRSVLKYLVATMLGIRDGCEGEDVVQRLLTSGMDIYLRGMFYADALQAAAREGHSDIVSELLDHRAGINECRGFFGTPLIAASMGGHATIVKILLQNGADKTIKSRQQRDALSAAEVGGYRDVMDLLNCHTML